MENEQKTGMSLGELIQRTKDKDFNIFFYVLDTKGNPSAGVAHIYNVVKHLNEAGYKAIILYDKKDYIGVKEWLGEEYSSLPHDTIENNVNLTPADIIVVPEIFANLMKQLAELQVYSTKIVMLQSPEYIYEVMEVGETWKTFGFNTVIGTSDTLNSYAKSIFPSIETHTISPAINQDLFNKSTKLRKPIFSIVARNQSDAYKVSKIFYAKYPMYKWVTIRELRGLSQEEFSNSLKESAAAIWIDDISGFGTYPIEALECGVPVIGVIPKILPEWLYDKNENGEITIKEHGVWVSNNYDLPDAMAEYMKAWLEDGITDSVYETIDNNTNQYTMEKNKKQTIEVFDSIISNKLHAYEETLKLQETKETENER
jgi:glycosyltransferase involved in cell wall biosynthesis